MFTAVECKCRRVRDNRKGAPNRHMIGDIKYYENDRKLTKKYGPIFWRCVWVLFDAK